MPNKTLYVKDEDVVIWDKARDIAGESLSQLIIHQLKNVVAEREAETQGNQRIVLNFLESGELPVSKAFYGRWVISPEKPLVIKDDQKWAGTYALAITAKRNVVTFDFFPGKKGEFYGWGIFHVFSSFEEARSTSFIPPMLIAEALTKVGVKVEELDI